jgi:hypothetical protein
MHESLPNRLHKSLPNHPEMVHSTPHSLRNQPTLVKSSIDHHEQPINVLISSGISRINWQFLSLSNNITRLTTAFIYDILKQEFPLFKLQ